jgi:rod shape-determining protein MreC
VYRKQVRRRRAVLGLLVAASLALLTAYFGEGSGGALHGFQRGVAAVLAPIQEGADRALKPARDLVNWFDQTFQARGDNKHLRNELADLRSKVAAGETATAENEQLRKLVGFDRKVGLPGGRVTARVIARSPTVWYSTVTVDHGSSSQIRVDDPVVTGDGLVGRVTQVTAGTAEVTLITDHTSAVSALVVPRGTAGVIKPEVGNPEDLVLDFIDKSHKISKGQRVVTAGWRAGSLASLFPYGIPIGEVSEASIAEQETYQRVHVKPYADIRGIQFVQVLTRTGRHASSNLTASTGGVP